VLLTFTFAALLAGLSAGVFFNRRAFEREVDSEVAELFAEVETMPTYFSADELEGLPAPVQRFFKRNLQDGQPHPSCVRVRDRGEVREAPGQPWTEFVGEVYAIRGGPAVLKFRRARPFPLVWVDSRAVYLRGRGRVVAKLFSSLTTVDEDGDAARRGMLLAYLAELALLPPALLPSDTLRWEPIDDDRATLIVVDGELEVRAQLCFDEFGNLVRFETHDRPCPIEDVDHEGPARWTVRFTERRDFGGLHLPTRIDAEWQLGELIFPHVRRNIDAVEVDVPRRWTGPNKAGWTGGAGGAGGAG